MTLGPVLQRVRVWHVLLLAFAARLAVGLANDGVLYPDEVMQYLEQAHRLVFGAGMVPWSPGTACGRGWCRSRWRCRCGCSRSSVSIPRRCINRSSRLCSAPQAWPYRTPAYRVARALFGDGAGWLALLFTAFWYKLVSYGHRATIDAIVAYVACAALALVFAPPTRAVRLACGALVGLAFVLRFQMAPALAAIALVATVRWRSRVWAAGLACVAVVAAGGAFDYYTWGMWFSAIVNSVALSAVGDLAAIFGVEPFWWYGPALVVLSGGLVLAGALGLASTRPRELAAAGAWRRHSRGVLANRAQADTVRLTMLTPIWLMGLAALTADRGALLASARYGATPRGAGRGYRPGVWFRRNLRARSL